MIGILVVIKYSKLAGTGKYSLKIDASSSSSSRVSSGIFLDIFLTKLSRLDLVTVGFQGWQ